MGVSAARFDVDGRDYGGFSTGSHTGFETTSCHLSNIASVETPNKVVVELRAV
jgi:hypothetical protein